MTRWAFAGRDPAFAGEDARTGGGGAAARSPRWTDFDETVRHYEAMVTVEAKPPMAGRLEKADAARHPLLRLTASAKIDMVPAMIDRKPFRHCNHLLHYYRELK